MFTAGFLFGLGAFMAAPAGTYLGIGLLGVVRSVSQMANGTVDFAANRVADSLNTVTEKISQIRHKQKAAA
jgi:hypothetical protein